MQLGEELEVLEVVPEKAPTEYEQEIEEDDVNYPEPEVVEEPEQPTVPAGA